MVQHLCIIYNIKVLIIHKSVFIYKIKVKISVANIQVVSNKLFIITKLIKARLRSKLLQQDWI